MPSQCGVDRVEQKQIGNLALLRRCVFSHISALSVLVTFEGIKDASRRVKKTANKIMEYRHVEVRRLCAPHSFWRLPLFPIPLRLGMAVVGAVVVMFVWVVAAILALLASGPLGVFGPWVPPAG